jgi:hypothetical protein
VVGNSWTYGAVQAPQPPDEKIGKLAPVEPKTIVITVKSIDAGKTETVVTLEEKVSTDVSKDPAKPKLDDKLLTTTITCSKTKFEISPDSFFFAGEPGGFYNLKLDKVDHPKGTTWTLTNGTIGEAEWREDLLVQWTRVPTEGSDAKLGDGKLELERKFTPQPQELIITKTGTYHAEKLGIVTTGRVTLTGAASKPMEMPAGWIDTVWVVENVGIVQTLNPYAHMYQLQDVTLK